MKNLYTLILVFISTIYVNAQIIEPLQCASGSENDQILYYNEDTKEIYIQTNSNDGFYENLPAVSNIEVRIVKYQLRGNGTLQYLNSLILESQIFSPYSLQKTYFADFTNQSETNPKFYQYRKIGGVEYEIINGDTSYLWPNTKLYVDIYDHNFELIDSNKLIYNSIDFYNCYRDITEILPISYKNKTYFNIKINPGYSIFCGSGVPYNIISVYDNNTKTVTKEISDNLYSEIHPFFLNDNLYTFNVSNNDYETSYCQLNKYDTNDSLISMLLINNTNINNNFINREFLGKAIQFKDRIIIQHIGTNDYGAFEDRVDNAIITIDTSNLEIINTIELGLLYGSMEKSNIFYYNTENYTYFNNSNNSKGYIYQINDNYIYFIDEDMNMLDSNSYYFEFNNDLELIKRDTISQIESSNTYWLLDLDIKHKIYLNLYDSVIFRLSANNDTLWKSNINNLLESINFSAIPYNRHIILSNETPYAYIPFFGSTNLWQFPIYIKYYTAIKINLENGLIDEKIYYNLSSNSSDDIEYPNNEYILENNLGDLILISNINSMCGYELNLKDIKISSFFSMLIDSLNTIYTKAFVDYNANNIQDNDEPIFNKGSVLISRNNTYLTNIYLDQNGTNSIHTDTGNYVLQLNYQNQLFSIYPSSKNINFTTYNNKDTAVFALQSIGQITDASISLVNTFITRPGNETTYLLTANNIGNQRLDNIRIALKLDSNLTVQSTSVPYTQNADSLIFNFSQLHASEIKNIEIRVLANNTLMFDDTLLNYATISTSTIENNLLNNSVKFEDIVRGSYDPNDKTSSSNSLPNLAENTDFITYTIRFENTGNDTAFNIIVRDTLSNNLNWKTLEILNTSHQYTLKIEQDSILIFTFKNILLPATSQNKLASHGYITYSIKPSASASTYDVYNTAHIIFDYNKPIKTNTTNTKIEQVLNNKENKSFNNQIVIYPNIAKDFVNIDISALKIKSYNVEITDMKGNKMLSKNEDKSITKIDLSNFTNGMYIVKITSSIGTASKKIIVQH